MERALKERIIGASVLVVFVVLVVPVFLDGPPEDGEMLRQAVTLPGQNEQETRTVVLARDRDEPVPVASPQPAEPVAASEPAVREAAGGEAGAAGGMAADKPPMREPAPPPEPARDDDPGDTARSASAAGTSTTGMFAVQLGSFSNQQNAEKLAADLRKQGFAAFLSQLETDGGRLHRVRIGPQKDRDAAEAMAVRLDKAGHKGQVVPHP